MKIAIIGLGLIGGSIARAARLKHPDIQIHAVGRTRTPLSDAVRDGVIDSADTVISDDFTNCDFIFLCTPVLQAEGYLDRLKPYLNGRTVLTDVGSTKLSIHRAVQRHGLSGHFIGGHPMTGSEKTGYRNSDALFLENAYYPLTPDPSAPDDLFLRFYDFVASLGAIPIRMDAKQHDYIVGAISHLPHLVAASLVNLVHAEDDEDERMRMLAAGGFKDITRIASSSPEMWRDIFNANRDNLIVLLDRFGRQLSRFRTALQESDDASILRLFTESKEYRDSFSDGISGPIRREFRLFCDIVDEKGSIAKIAALLANRDISIRNIGIVHNREFEEGVLKILFYDRSAEQRARAALSEGGYHVYDN